MTDHADPICRQYERLLRTMDDVVARIEQFQIRPDFARNVTERTNRTPDFTLADVMLKTFVELIAFSNNARADVVREIVRTGALDEAFPHYNVREVAELEPALVIEQHWPRTKGIRFRSKVYHMIDCARVLLDIQAEHGSFMRYLQAQAIPTSVQDTTQLRSFWQAFDATRADLFNDNYNYPLTTIRNAH